jgi:hypothetical protein
MFSPVGSEKLGAPTFVGWREFFVKNYRAKFLKSDPT